MAREQSKNFSGSDEESEQIYEGHPKENSETKLNALIHQNNQIKIDQQQLNYHLKHNAMNAYQNAAQRGQVQQ